MRKFLTLDGEVLSEENWIPKDSDLCFYCNRPLTEIDDYDPCWESQTLTHDWVTLTDPSEYRR